MDASSSMLARFFGDFRRSERRFGAHRAGPILQRIKGLRIFALYTRARARETTKIPGVRTLMGELCQTYARGSPYTAPQSAALFAINGSTTTLVNDESAPSGTIIGANAIPSLSNQENTGCAFQS